MGHELFPPTFSLELDHVICILSHVTELKTMSKGKYKSSHMTNNIDAVTKMCIEEEMGALQILVVGISYLTRREALGFEKARRLSLVHVTYLKTSIFSF